MQPWHAPPISSSTRRTRFWPPACVSSAPQLPPVAHRMLLASSVVQVLVPSQWTVLGSALRAYVLTIVVVPELSERTMRRTGTLQLARSGLRPPVRSAASFQFVIVPPIRPVMFAVVRSMFVGAVPPHEAADRLMPSAAGPPASGNERIAPLPVESAGSGKRAAVAGPVGSNGGVNTLTSVSGGFVRFSVAHWVAVGSGFGARSIVSWAALYGLSVPVKESDRQEAPLMPLPEPVRSPASSDAS